jgi:hypothetical protein
LPFGRGERNSKHFSGLICDVLSTGVSLAGVTTLSWQNMVAMSEVEEEVVTGQGLKMGGDRAERLHCGEVDNGDG